MIAPNMKSLGLPWFKYLSIAKKANRKTHSIRRISSREALCFFIVLEFDCKLEWLIVFSKRINLQSLS